jgi:hypothetical protein
MSVADGRPGAGVVATRRVFVFALVLPVTLVATDGAAAQSGRGRAPWCAEVLAGDPDCSYYSWQQCWARASGVSNICYLNPYYEPSPANPPPRRRSRPRPH